MSCRLTLPLLTLALTLAACGGGTPPAGGGGGTAPICEQGLTPAALPVPESAVLPTAVSRPDWSAPHVPGQVLVTGADGTLSAQTLSAQSLGVLSTLRTQQVTEGLKLASTPVGETDHAFAVRLARAGLRVQPNFVYQPLALPDDPGYPGNGGIKLGGDNTAYVQHYLPRIRAGEAWAFLQGCGKTPVAALTAVMDTGADGTHMDLRGRLLTGRSFVNGDDAATTDSTGHGTGVAGLIGAATNNAAGLVGVTWSGQNILPVKVLGASGATTATLAQGLDYAVKQGAKVINMSLGIEQKDFKPDANPGDAALDQALNNAAKSAVLIAAAGNNPGSGDFSGVYYPASNPNVIAVGAVGARDNKLACYSERPTASNTRKIDIVAPGGAGWGRCPETSPQQNLLVLAPGGGYQLVAGTSEAAPLVSGVAALMRAANPRLTAAETRRLLLASVRQIESPDFPDGGLPLLNAEAAVRAATR